MSDCSVLVDLSPEQKIYRHLKDNGQSIQWLANKLPISRSHLSRIINGRANNKRTLAPDVRAQINQILKTNY
jgi:plasmid maintenance system antidote protein VapI